LKSHDLITSPAFVVIKAANEFHTKTTRPNQMWQTDFTYCAPRVDLSAGHMFRMR
jgi:putative transposase